MTGCVTGAADGAADRGEAMRWKMVVEGRDNNFHKSLYVQRRFNEIFSAIHLCTKYG